MNSNIIKKKEFINKLKKKQSHKNIVKKNKIVEPLKKK